MTAPSDRVILQIKDQLYEGWKSVRVTAGIERAARDFDIDITLRWPGQSGPDLPCVPGDACALRLGDDLVVTGYVDAVPVRYDAHALTVAVNGRSRTADLVDCSAHDAPGQWLGQKVETIAAALAKPYGIAVRTEVDTGRPIADHQVQQGETVFESLDRLLRQRQLLATDDAAGALVITKPGLLRATTALELGGNILTGEISRDWRDRFSEYQAKGQGSGTDSLFGVGASECLGSATDKAIRRHRLLVVTQSGQADTPSCGNRAEYERDLRAAKSEAVTYTVQGWRQADGALWKPNMMVHVTDAWLGIDRDLLITEVAYTLDEGGMLTTLSLTPPEGYTVPNAGEDVDV
ncbi:MAG: baseplate protein [Alphaproteobacteria bacterium]|nr:MAG: baseplate protein [Alphaproteobacteria bacterium]